MARYDFVSPGAMAGNAIQQFLMQRAMEERQARMDQLAAERQSAEIGQREADLGLRRQQEARIAEAQAQQQKDLEQEREFRRASVLAENAIPGDPIDPDTKGVMERQGFGGAMRTIPGQPASEGFGVLESLEQPAPGAGVLQNSPPPGILQPAQPERTIARGGSKYLSARQAAEERAAQAAEARAAREAEGERNRQFRGEQGEANRALREDLARASASGRGETTALRNDLLRTQVDAATQKAEDKQVADKRARDAARVTSGATIDVIKELADFDERGRATLKPGTANLFGARNPLARLVPGSDTNNAKAALDRLKGRVIVDLLNEMKNQSRTGATGFGALSGPELKLLENAAAELNSSMISDTRAAAELERIYSMAKQLYGDEPGNGPANGGPSGGSGRVYYDEEGNQVQR
jgi:hypothetical protein